MLRLHTFGGLALRGPTESTGATLGKRPLALLALMAVAGARGLRREKVIALLWPESDEERGRNSLSQALTALRRELGGDGIAASSAELRLDPTVIASDVQEFECAVRAGDLECAVTLYEGAFLDGVHLKGAQGFDEWVSEQRLRLQRLQATACERLALAAEERGDRPAAVAAWRRLADLEPASARAALGLMRALAALGDRGAALQHYRVYEAVLREGVGAEPDQAVAQFAATLRTGNGSVIDTPTPAAVHGHALERVVPARDVVSHDRPVDAAIHVEGDATLPRDSRPSPRRVGARWGVGFVAVAVVAALAIAARADRGARPSDHQVEVVPFRNLTGDSTLDAVGFLAAQHIADGLQRSALVEVTDPITITDVSRGIGSSGAPDTNGTNVPHVGDHVPATLRLGGSYSLERDSLALVARLTDPSRGTLVAVSEPVRIATSASVSDLERVRQRALGMLAVRLDRSLDDLLPPGSSPPPTLAAYTEFLEGLQRFQRREPAAASPFFRRAYTLDSSFVAALVWRAWAAGWDEAGEVDRRRAVAELARHRDRLAPLDRQALAYLEANQRRDIPARIAALQRASQLAPGSVWTYNVGNAFNGLGRNDEAVAAFDQIDRTRGWLRYWPALWRGYARALHYVDHERELQIVREARAVLSVRFPGGGPWAIGLMLDEARALIPLHRYAELERLIADIEAANDPGRSAGNVLSQIAMEMWDRGDTAQARTILNRSLAWYGTLSDADANRSDVRMEFGEALYHTGRSSQARAIFDRLAAEFPDMRAVMFAGLSAARAGDSTRAEEVIRQIEAMPDSSADWNTVQTSRLICLARLAAVLGHRDRAVDYIKRLNVLTGSRLSRHVQHKDFASLEEHPPFLRVTRPRK